MATQHPNGSIDGTTVTLTRDQRDALHREIRSYILDDGGYLGDFHSSLMIPGRGFDARERWAKMSSAARLLDAIGWDKLSDRGTYTLTIDRDLAEFVRWRLDETEGTLAEHSGTFADIHAGRDPWARYRPADAPEGALRLDIADLRDQVDGDLEVVGACRAILNQLGEPR